MFNSKQDNIISIKSLVKAAIYGYYSLFINKKTYKKVVFILGHARSSSSLLTHILTSNPKVIGYGESHIKYYTEDDFVKLAAQVHWKLRKPIRLNGDLLLDKMLFDFCLPNLDLLKSDKIYAIFLIREPCKSLRSIYNVRIKIHNDHRQEEVLKYYLNRLSTLEKYSKIINSKHRSCFVTHDQLINETELVLEKLQKFLNLKHPLSEEYKILPTTGKRGPGDWSDKIKTGQIVRNNKSTGAGIEIQPELIERGLQGFHKCYKTLSQHCTTLAD